MWERTTFDPEQSVRENPSAPLCFELKKWRLAAVWLREEMYIFRDRCPHMGASFEGGRIEDQKLVCPKHRYRFDPRDQDPNIAPGCLSLLEWRRSGAYIEIDLK